MNNSKHHRTCQIIALTIMLAIAIVTNAQNHDWHQSKIVEYTQDKLHRAEDIINEKLDQKDTLYITPNAYNMTIMTQYSYAYEYYRFSARDKSQSLSLRPGNGNKAGLYVGWKWLFLGWNFDMTKNDAKHDINLSFYTAKIGIDLLYRKRDKGFNLSATDGFVNEQGEKIRNYDRRFDGFSTKQKGINVYYIFNNKKFSYPAAYSQTTNQRISAGSFILGLTYNEQTFHFNYAKIDPALQKNLKEELKFDKVKYKDFSINFGYTYNWVFAKNCLANISVTPGIGYKNSSLKIKNSKEFISNINVDLITRAALVYNTGKYFIGTSLISHTYSYRKSELSVINGFGTINIYAGFYFWKKKPKTKP